MPNPNDKIKIYRGAYGTVEATETHGEVTLNPLTAEALRDIARNESAPSAWRKAAVKLLMKRKHEYMWHPDLISMMAEIKEEEQAERDVQDVVESVTEEPLEG